MLKYEIVITDYDINSLIAVLKDYVKTTQMSEESYQYYNELQNKLRGCLERKENR